MECLVFQSVRDFGISKKQIERAVFWLLRRMHKEPANVSVHAIGDRRMRRLNRIHRGQDTTTDVLAFSAVEGQALAETSDIGDIFLCKIGRAHV